MEAQRTECDLRTMIEELRRENSDLRSQVAWRKDETIRLRRSIGSGRVYHKLRQSILDVEEENEALLKRVEELESVHLSWESDQEVDTTFLKTIIQPLIEAGNTLQHKTWPECECEKCTSWRKVKESLCCRFSWLNDELGELEWIEESRKPAVLKASGI